MFGRIGLTCKKVLDKSDEASIGQKGVGKYWIKRYRKVLGKSDEASIGQK